MASRFVAPVFDSGNGISPSDGSQLFFFITGTSTPKDTFTTEAATVANANPVIADASGVFPDIFISGSYKVQLKDKNGVQTGFGEADPVSAAVDASTASLAFATTALMQASTPDVGQRLTTNEFSTGSGGGSDYIVEAGDTSDTRGRLLNANGTTSVLQDAETAPLKAFGADGSNVIDATTIIQGVIDLGFPVLNTGDDGSIYKVSRMTGRSNLQIRGDGTFDFSANAAFADTFADPLMPFVGTAGSALLLTVNAVNEDLTLTMADTSSLSAGNLIELATPTDDGGFLDASVTVANGEMFEILSVDSGTVITLTTHVIDESGYTTANAAQVRLITPVENVVIDRSIKIKGKGRDVSASGDIGLFFQYCRNIKVHCQMEDVDARAVFFASCYEYKATHQRIVHPQKGANSTVNYGISPADSSKFGEVAYNDFHNMRHAMITAHLGSSRPTSFGVSRVTNIHHNKAYNTWSTAYATHEDAELVFMDNNEATDCDAGVNPRERRMTVKDNKMFNCGQDVLLTGRPRQLMISGNEGYGGGNLVTESITATMDMNDVSIIGNKKFGGEGGVNLTLPAPTTSHKRLVVSLNEVNDVDGVGGNSAGVRIEGALDSPIISNNTVNGFASGGGFRIAGVANGSIVGNHSRNVSGNAYTFVTGITNTYAKENTAKGYGTFINGGSNLANSATVSADNTDMGA